MARTLVVLLVLVVLAIGAGGWILWSQGRPGIEASLDPATLVVGHAKREVKLVLRAPAGAIREVQVIAAQGGATKTLLTEEMAKPRPKDAERMLALDAAGLGWKEGEAEIRVFARDTVFRVRKDPAPKLVAKLTVDLTPPSIQLVSATGYLKPAGAGIVVYRAPGAARSGVQAGGGFFPGVGGIARDPAVQVALYTIPWDWKEPQPPALIAEDEAGNLARTGVPVTLLPWKPTTDRIELRDDFLRRKVPELAPQTPGDAAPDALLSAFLKVNGEGRKQAEAKIASIGESLALPKPLWKGVFRQQPNTKVFAGFPQERTYVYGGKTVDTQFHLGLDLASNKRSPVEATGAGKVAFVGQNGIYGNMVVLDHGLGLGSLYAHLSEFAVKEGDEIPQGGILGRSGETGFAGGDHLHFAMLVHGVYTNPLEWWDAGWIRDRFALPLLDAGIELPGITDATQDARIQKAGSSKRSSGVHAGSSRRN